MKTKIRIWTGLPSYQNKKNIPKFAALSFLIDKELQGWVRKSTIHKNKY